MQPSDLKAAGILLLVALSGCSAEPEEEGACKLQCSSPKVASIDFVVEPLFELEAVTCKGPPTAPNPFSGPVMVAYRISEQLNPTASGQGSGPMSTDLAARKIPRSNIAFEPLAGGAMYTPKTNPEHLGEDSEGKIVPSPARFDGVVTPVSEWCSDSCGVMRYEVWPRCDIPSEGTVSMGILVQGIIVENQVSFGVTGEDTTKEAEPSPSPDPGLTDGT